MVFVGTDNLRHNEMMKENSSFGGIIQSDNK